MYIVPTRALISEITRDFRNTFKHFGLEDISISSAPSNYSERTSKRMLVFTQERYHIFLYDIAFSKQIDVLIIDEAQKVSDGGRGITLEEVIEESIKRNPNLQVVFITPFSKNPQKFALMFNLNNLIPEKTKRSPVSHNLLLLDIAKGEYSIRLSTAELENFVPISSGIVHSTEFSDIEECKDWRLLWAAKKFGKDFNLVYCNSPKGCLRNARIFASALPDKSDPAIEEVVKFLKTNIHEEYYLIHCLRKGIAYHHGKMPNQIRNIIEKLFRDRKLNYVFCTSTLLEGVNFPAQSIFLDKPKIGITHMEKLDFWNLAGRAGRLLKDYFGNIYCINIDKWTKFQPDPKDMENEIESILESTIINKNTEVMEYLKDVYFELKQKDKHIEQAIAKFIIQDLKAGRTDFINRLLKRNPEFQINQIQAISTEIERLSQNITVPYEILQKNSSIDPRKQQELLEKFADSNNILIPPIPNHKGFYNDLRDLYKFINVFFMNKDDESYKYFTWLTAQWVHDHSMWEIIKGRIQSVAKDCTPTSDMINNEIEGLFKDINDSLRYEYQKFLKCYIDILVYFYELMKFDTSEICRNLPTYIEFGSYKRNVILLQSIGLSRSTAIVLDGIAHITFSDENDCINWLKGMKQAFKYYGLPTIYLHEISEIV